MRMCGEPDVDRKPPTIKKRAMRNSAKRNQIIQKLYILAKLNMLRRTTCAEILGCNLY